MIGIEHLEIAEFMQGRVTKLVVHLTQAHRLDDCPVRDATQRHDNGVLGQQAQLVRQEFVAIIYLGTDRLVIRRQTFDGIGNAAVDKLEVVTGRLRMVAALPKPYLCNIW
jgi:hypothetical protein